MGFVRLNEKAACDPDLIQGIVEQEGQWLVYLCFPLYSLIHLDTSLGLMSGSELQEIHRHFQMKDLAPPQITTAKNIDLVSAIKVSPEKAEELIALLERGD